MAYQGCHPDLMMYDDDDDKHDNEKGGGRRASNPSEKSYIYRERETAAFRLGVEGMGSTAFTKLTRRSSHQ